MEGNKTLDNNALDTTGLRIGEFDPKSHSQVQLLAMLYRVYRLALSTELQLKMILMVSKQLTDSLEQAQTFIINRYEQMVGVVSILTIPDPNGGGWYNREDVCRFGLLAVAKEERSKGLGRILLGLVEVQAEKTGKKYIAAKVPLEAAHLIAYYVRAGFIEMNVMDADHHNVAQVVLIKALHIREQLDLKNNNQYPIEKEYKE